MVPGDTFAVSGATVRYTGLATSGSRLVVELEVLSGTLDGAEVITGDGTRLAVESGSGSLHSAPFGNASQPPGAHETLTLRVHDQLLVLEVGEIR